MTPHHALNRTHRWARFPCFRILAGFRNLVLSYVNGDRSQGEAGGIQATAAECIKQTKEKDTKTIRYDWFLSRDETECEIREAYESAEGLVEHRTHIAEALNKLFSEFANNHTVTVYGEPSPQLVEMARRMPQGTVKWYSFLQGLDS